MPGIVEKWGGVIVTRHAGLRIENGSCAEKEDGGAMLWRNEKDMEVSSEQAEGSKPGNIKAKKCEKTWMVSNPHRFQPSGPAVLAQAEGPNDSSPSS